MPEQSGSAAGTALIVLAAVAFGTVPFFARGLIEGGMSPVAVAFWRFALSGIVLAPLLLRVLHERAAILWAVSAGLALGVGWIGYATALETLPVATAGVLYMTYPLFTALLGWLWFGFRPTQRTLLAAGLVLAAALVSSSTGPVSRSDLPAMLLALAAPLGFAYGIAVLTMKLAALPVLSRMASVQLGATLGLLPLFVATGGTAAAVVPASAGGWWLVAGAAIVTALLPQLVYTIYAPRVGATRTAVAGSAELPTMFLVGWLAFSEPLGPGQWLACALIVVAIFLAPARPTRGGDPDEEIGRPKAP